MSEIQSKVFEIIKDRLNVAEKDIEMSSSFANDLGADSLDTVELIMENLRRLSSLLFLTKMLRKSPPLATLLSTSRSTRRK